MKKAFFTLLLIAFGLLAQAQNISVKDFYYAENDLTARTHGTKVEDQNGYLCALIKVRTTEKGMWTFDVGMLGVTKTEMQNANHSAEIWVYVPFGVTRMTIQHEKLGILDKWPFPCSIEKGCTYIMELTTGNVHVFVEEAMDQQFIVFNVTPKDAIVTVDGEPLPVLDGRADKRVKLGKHEYRIEAQDYHTEVGRAEVNADKKTEVNVTLKPAFGYLKIEGDHSILQQAAVYVDKQNGAEALRSGMRLGSGQHTVRVVHSKYKPYEQTVTIKDGETMNLSVNLGANYSKVTLNVEGDAEIYVDGEHKGTGSWTGDLVAGEYLVECRKQNHRASQRRVNITDRMSGEVITLDPPMPINGRLVVTSTPSGAKVFIDGRQVDETPMQLSAILIGEHILRLEKEGCAPLAKTFTIEEGKTLTLDETLDTGRSIVVKTDRSGDKIYVDGDYVGETPRETPLGFGQHTVRVVRNGVKVEKEVDIKESTRNGLDLVFEFGRLITISTDQLGDVVMVDGETVGTSPVSVDLPEGRHSIHALRDKKYADKEIEVLKEGGETSYLLIPEKDGVFFVMANAAYSLAPQTSFGLTVGSVKRWGWYASVGTNFKYVKAGYECVSDGSISDMPNSNYRFTKEETMRLSVTAGAVAKIAKPVSVYLGAGYGLRNLIWHFEGDGVSGVAKNTAYSHEGVALDGGMMFHIGHFSGSLGVQTVNFGYVEAKIGLGINF